MKLAGLTLQIKSLDVFPLLDWEFVIKVQIKRACELRKARPFLLHCQDPITALDLWIRNLFDVPHSCPTASSEEDIVACRFLSLTFFPAFSSAPLLWGRTGPCKLPARVTHIKAESGRSAAAFAPFLHPIFMLWGVFPRALSVPTPSPCVGTPFSTCLSPHDHVLAAAASHVSVRNCCLKEKETYTVFPEAFPSPVQQRVWFAM